jgi:hypothetical protein
MDWQGWRGSFTVAPKDQMSVCVDHLNPSKASGLRNMAAPMTWPSPRGSMSGPTCHASPTRHDQLTLCDSTESRCRLHTAVSQLDVYYCRGIFIQVEEDIVWFDVFVDLYSASDTWADRSNIFTCMSYSLCVEGAQSLQGATSDRFDIGSREFSISGQAKCIGVQVFQNQKWWVLSVVEHLSYVRAMRELLQNGSLPV